MMVRKNKNILKKSSNQENERNMTPQSNNNQSSQIKINSNPSSQEALNKSSKYEDELNPKIKITNQFKKEVLESENAMNAVSESDNSNNKPNQKRNLKMRPSDNNVEMKIFEGQDSGIVKETKIKINKKSKESDYSQFKEVRVPVPSVSINNPNKNIKKLVSFNPSEEDKIKADENKFDKDLINNEQRPKITDPVHQEPMTRIRSQKTFRENQEIEINNDSANRKFPRNVVETTRYNFITFLPKAILIQFLRPANIYFLIIAIIQSIPVVSPLSSTTAIAPLVFVISVSLIREAIEDWFRYVFDRKNNHYPVKVYHGGNLVDSISENLRVGRIIVLKENEIAPADILVLDTCLGGGACYSETATLDGEKTLKNKSAPKELAGLVFDTKNLKDQNKNKIDLNDIRERENNKFNQKNDLIPSLQRNGLDAPDFLNATGKIVCDGPNEHLYNFDGSLEITFIKSNNETITVPPIGVDNNNVILKGSSIKNTPVLVGAIVYAGHNTKIMLNSKNSKVKYSELEKLVSKILLVIVFLQCILCIAAAVSYDFFYRANVKNNPYLPEKVYDYPADSAINYFTYLLLLNTLIPISLIITLEIVKVIQAYFISVDCLGYSHVRKEFIKTNSVSLNEELGNVNFIFSDKTGTLTCNKMGFKNAIIGDRCYDVNGNSSEDGSIVIESLKNHALFQNEAVKEYFKLLSLTHECTATEENGNLVYTGSSPDDVELVKVASMFGYSCTPSSHPLQKAVKFSQIKNFPTFGNEEDHKDKDSSYSRHAHSNQHSYDQSRTVEYKIETINEFTSARKRMSIIFYEVPQTQVTSSRSQQFTPEYYTVYIKGADSEIKKRLNPEENSISNSKLEKCVKYISHFASQGLRILMLAKKTISKAEFDNFIERLNEANLDLLNKSYRVNKVIDDFESGFDLVGATVVEDKLQDKVPETIKRLKMADIKVWMLTGDSFDTAKKIGLSCNLLNTREKIFEINGEKGDTVEKFFREFEVFYNNTKQNLKSKNTSNPFVKKSEEDANNIKQLNQIKIQHNNSSVNASLKVDNNENPHTKSHKPNNEEDKNVDNNNKTNIDRIVEDKKFFTSAEGQFEIVVDRVGLYQIFKKASITVEFLKIASKANSVVCCRVSPMQKAQIVAEMKNFDKKAKTLAIGDGGNDVSMIMEANIGVGVYGEEGMRAVQACDYAIGEFKILQRLLFFHGRISLFRISKLIYYFFYKNFVFTISHFYFLFMNNSSGQSIFEDWFITFYNLIYTALPIGFLACSDIDIRPEDGELVDALNPILYKESRDNPIFTTVGFISTLVLGLIASLQQFLFIIFAISNTPIDSKGNTADLWTISFIYFTGIILFATSAVINRLSYQVLLFHLVLVFLSLLPYCLSILWFQNYSAANSSGSYDTILNSARFYLVIVLNFGVGILIELTLNTTNFTFSKRLSIILQLKRNEYKTLPSIEEAKVMEPFSDYLQKYDNM